MFIFYKLSVIGLNKSWMTDELNKRRHTKIYLESKRFTKEWNKWLSTRLMGKTFPTNSFIKASSIEFCLAFDIFMLVVNFDWTVQVGAVPARRKTGLLDFSGWFALPVLWSWSRCHCKLVVFPAKKIKCHNKNFDNWYELWQLFSKFLVHY